MELSTLLGVVVGVISVVGAMIFKKISFEVLLNPAAFFVILVGTVATILNSYTGAELKNIGTLFKILFTAEKNNKDPEKRIIDEIMSLATMVRKEGLLSLESKLGAMEDPFLRKGLQMVVDGADPEYVYEVLFAELDAMKERHAANAGIFASAGTYAPTLGVLGAVFGLIAAMSHIDDTEAMAEAIAAAFVATILGIFTGYVLWNPFSSKLKAKSKREVFEKTLIVEGVLSIQKGEAPVRIKEKLVALLPLKQQKILQSEAAQE